jgi:hypothetical protein
MSAQVTGIKKNTLVFDFVYSILVFLLPFYLCEVSSKLPQAGRGAHTCKLRHSKSGGKRIIN